MPNLMNTVRTFCLVGLLCLTSKASAQLGGGRIDRPLDTPTFSPYLNMLRSGGPALNYYGLVRPQQEFAQQNQQLGQGLQMLQTQQMQQNQSNRMNSGGYGYSQLGVTGHAVGFNTFGTGQFSGGYSGSGGLGGGGFGGGSAFGGGQNGFGGMNSGFNQFGGQGMTGNGTGYGFSGISGHAAQFGGIGNSFRGR